MDFNKIHRLETGNRELNVTDMRRIAKAFDLKASALLPDEDVELRADESGTALIAVVGALPAPYRPEVLKMASELVRVVRAAAAGRSAAALEGEPRQVSELADLWNEYTPEARDRTLGILKLSGNSG